jgi:predicted transglutaminase-like cysteine proteinase
MRATAIVRTLWVSSILAAAVFTNTSSAATITLQASYAAIGGQTSVPYGWLDFCRRQAQECNQPVLPALDVNLTSETWQILNKVNHLVNQTIVPVSNYDHWGTILDHWDYPTDGKGDCKIYALWKRKLLMDAGFPRQALLMTIVRDQNGEGHTILTVKTNHGEFILDNMREEIRPWDETGYHFYKRQSQQDPNIWVAIIDPNPHVSSLR